MDSGSRKLFITSYKRSTSVFFNPIRAITPYDNNRILVGIDGGGVYFVDKHTSETKLFVNTEDSGEFFYVAMESMP